MFLAWKDNYYWGQEDRLSLHHYYRALIRLTRVIGKVEEFLYERGRDLFSGAVGGGVTDHAPGI